MLRLLVACLLILAPTAAAASQLHITYLGGSFALTFVSNATTSVPVTFDGGSALATRVEAPSGDNDTTFRALIPARALTYYVEGKNFSVRAPPALGAPTRIAYVADIGLGDDAEAVLAAIQRADPDLVVIGGDLSYANGNESIWNEWFELIEPLAARVPIMPVFGNHEAYCEGRAFSLHHCGPAPNGWHTHFALPNGDALYYAFDWGPLRIVALNTEEYGSGEPATDADAQEEFLNDSLDPSEDRWNVVTFHRPLRTTNAKEGLASPGARASLEPLLDGRADLVLQAHAHAYERAKPSNGTLYVTSGGGGRPLYDQWEEMAPWMEKRAAEHHFLILNATRERIEVVALRPDGSTLDAFTLERPAPPTPPATPSATPSVAWPTPSSTPNLTPSPTLTPPTFNVSESESSETPGPGALIVLATLVLVAWRFTTRRGVRRRW